MSKFRELTPEDYDQLVEALRTARQRLPISERRIGQLAERARIREVSQGEVIMRQGEPPDFLYFVISGQLRAADTGGDQPHLLNYHATRTFAGELGLVYDQPRSATVDVISSAKLACWDQAVFDWLLTLDDRMRPYFENLYQRREERKQQDFPGKQWDEVVVVRTGKHPLMLVSALAGPVLVLLASIGLLTLLLITGSITSTCVGVIIAIPIIGAVGWGLHSYVDWRDDEYIVTSKRVIHIERFVFYGAEWHEAPLIRIQDITLEARNWWQRTYDYHNLTIKTAGAANIVFSGVRNAPQAQEHIFEERAKALERLEAPGTTSIRMALAQRMGLDVPEAELPPDTPISDTPVLAPKAGRRLPGPVNYFCPRVVVVDGERITWRKHWIVLLRKTWLPLLLTFVFSMATLLLLLHLPPFRSVLEALGHSWWILAAAPAAGALISYGWYTFRYDDWHRDVYIVTRNRIIDVESSAFRLRGETSREGTFDVVQNITYSIPGILHKLLNMGDVIIETAGTERTFTFMSVFNPIGVQQEIFNRWVAYQEGRRRHQRESEAQRMAEWIGEYDSMRK